MRNALVSLILIITPITVFAEPYDRGLYRHWIDADGDCQDTREEVLIEESLVPVQMDERGCKVVTGLWVDPYTGTVMTVRGQIDIDHMVPLREAHVSGADIWDAAQREEFANDLDKPDSLVAVLAGANRSKGDRDPSQWMPPNRAFWCEYLDRWTNVKIRWQLALDEAEKAAIARGRRDCPRYRVGDSLDGR